MGHLTGTYKHKGPPEKKIKSFRVTFDAARSMRSTDENGFLHVASSHITKATVNPYYGNEIPGGVEKGLDPDKIYYGLRDPEELKASLPTWAGLPLHLEHHIDTADDPQHDTRVGTVGSEIRWDPPYIDADLTIWDQLAIDGVEDGSFRELSCAYRYTPDFTSGEYNGHPYDFVMRDIRGNHVALVEEGRAGPDVLVADAKPAKMITEKVETMKKNKKSKWFAKDEAPEETAQDEGGSLDELKAVLDELKQKLAPEDVAKLAAVIAGMSESGTDENLPGEERSPEEQKAYDAGVEFGKTLSEDDGLEESGMRDAMDKAGCDADNPEEAAAFAEGVKDGEATEATDDGDEADNLEGAATENLAGDEGEEDNMVNTATTPEEGQDEEPEETAPVATDHIDVESVIAGVPGLSEEQATKLRELLSVASTDEEPEEATDEDETENKEAAQDKAIRRARIAADSARIHAKAEAVKHLRDLNRATQMVRPLVGSLDPLAFDSASNVYGYALEQSGVNPHKYPRAAWKGMVDMMVRQQTASFGMAMASDSKPVPTTGPLAGLSRIKISD